MKWLASLFSIAMVLTPPALYADSKISAANSEQGGSVELGIGASSGFGWVFHGGEGREGQFGRSVAKLGQTFGLLVSVAPHERFASRLEILYMAKGADVEYLDGTHAGTLDATYLGGALLGEVNLIIGRSLRPYALVGAELGYLLEAKTISSTTGNVTILTDDSTTLDIGVIAGAGVGWRVAPRHEITFETRIDIGLRTVDDSEGNDNELLNRSLMFTLGYRFSVLPGRHHK